MATTSSRLARSTTVADPQRVAAPTGRATRTTLLVGCGLVFGPLFYLVAIIQMVIRPGFDLRRHAISLLSLGDLGWIQSANFLVTGVLALLCAIGLRRRLRGSRGGTWGPALIGVSGVAMAAAAFVHPDPGLGFPPGAPAGMPTTMSGHAALHMLAFSVALLSLIAACGVFARRFLGQGRRGWGRYCVATAIVSLVLVMLSMSVKDGVGVFMAVGVAVVFGWVAALAGRVLTAPV